MCSCIFSKHLTCFLSFNSHFVSENLQDFPYNLVNNTDVTSLPSIKSTEDESFLHVNQNTQIVLRTQSFLNILLLKPCEILFSDFAIKLREYVLSKWPENLFVWKFMKLLRKRHQRFANFNFDQVHDDLFNYKVSSFNNSSEIDQFGRVPLSSVVEFEHNDVSFPFPVHDFQNLYGLRLNFPVMHFSDNQNSQVIRMLTTLQTFTNLIRLSVNFGRSFMSQDVNNMMCVVLLHLKHLKELHFKTSTDFSNVLLYVIRSHPSLKNVKLFNSMENNQFRFLNYLAAFPNRSKHIVLRSSSTEDNACILKEPEFCRFYNLKSVSLSTDIHIETIYAIFGIKTLEVLTIFSCRLFSVNSVFHHLNASNLFTPSCLLKKFSFSGSIWDNDTRRTTQLLLCILNIISNHFQDSLTYLNLRQTGLDQNSFPVCLLMFKHLTFLNLGEFVSNAHLVQFLNNNPNLLTLAFYQNTLDIQSFWALIHVLTNHPKLENLFFCKSQGDLSAFIEFILARNSRLFTIRSYSGGTLRSSRKFTQVHPALINEEYIDDAYGNSSVFFPNSIH